MNSQQLVVACVAAADEFLARRLWRRFENQDLLAFQVPGQDLLVGSIMGAAGEEFGLFLLHGERALDDQLAIIAGDRRLQDQQSKLISVSLDRIADLQPPFDRFLKQAKRTGRTGPVFLVKEPGKQLRIPHRQELETILYVLRGILAADDRGQLRPGALLEDRVLPMLRLSGEPDDPGVKVDLAAIGEGRERPLPAIALPEGLAGLPRLDASYEVGYCSVPAIVADSDDEMWVLAAADVESGLARIVEVLAGRDLVRATGALFAGLRGDGPHAMPGLPRRIAFANEALFRVLQPGLLELGVSCEYQPELPALDELFDNLDRWLMAEGEADDPGISDEFRIWKVADLDLSERIAELAVDQAMESAKAWKRYFGRSRDETPPTSDSRTQMALASYVQWYAFAHRAKPRSKTVAERVLDQDLDELERALLQARIAARPSLYQVREVEPADSLLLTDVLVGREIEVFDHSLSQNATPGLAFFALVYPAGPYHFAALAGPPVSPLEIEAVTAFLADEHGLELDGPVPAAASHLLGRLWEWQREHGGQALERLQLTNTDGEPLLGHQARFDVGDPAALIAALDARDDVVVDEPGAAWSWQRGDLHLGRLELFDRELLLDVNSAERHRRARDWLEEVPGVRFVKVTEIELDPRKRAAENTPLDDRLPRKEPQLDAEGRAQVQAFIDEKCFAWLDERIPALGGRTPREACATTEGRRQVERLIRTYPDPRGIPGLKTPRAEMMRRLGLGDEGAAEG